MSQDMVSSRRGFVAVGAALAALPLVTSGDMSDTGTNGEAVRPVRPFALQELADWQGQIGWRFAVQGEDGRVPMRLISVEKGSKKAGARPAHGREQTFIATFAVDAASAPKGSATYPVRHAMLGSTDLYLERGKAQGGTAFLHAAFG